MTRARRMLPVALALLVLAVAVRIAHSGEFPDSWTFDDDDKSKAAHAEVIGKPMPALEVSDWVNGAVTADDMKGKVVVIDFYATWCGPCMRAIPHTNELMTKYKEKGVVVFGVCTSAEGQEKMEEVAKSQGMKYPTAKDPKLAAEKAWRVMYYPTYAVVDRTGKVRALGVQPDYVGKVVEKILDEDKKEQKKD